MSLCGFAALAQTTPKALSEPVFTSEQEARIGEISKDYLLAHPEVLLEVSVRLQALQQQKLIKDITAAALQNQVGLLLDKGSPSIGPKMAKVTVVAFFDYQCINCVYLSSELGKVIKANPDVRFVFKEWPIFGPRWRSSLLAARTGLQIWQQQGADAYLSYHNALFATVHNKGKLTAGDILVAAKTVAFDSTKTINVDGTLEETNVLAKLLGLTGTPALVVIPSTEADLHNVTVILGISGADVLQEAIDKVNKSS